MEVCEPGGNSREAVTWYEVLERFPHATSVKLLPKTGRTHQLRVHMAHLGHAIVADSQYGGRSNVTRAELEGQRDSTDSPVIIARQALHARRLCFRHPESGKPLEFEAPLPADMHATLDILPRTT